MRYALILLLASALAAQKKPAAPMPNFAGVLKHMDAKSIVLDLDDNRTLDFRRTGKTAFVNVKEAALKPGDHISVEATEDIEGFLTAVNVRLEAAGATPAPAETAAPASPPAPPPPPATERRESAQVAAEQDPNRPILSRGKPPARPRRAEPEPQPEPAPAPAAKSTAPAPPPAPVAAAEIAAEDPLIQKARAASEAFSGTLPNYVCREVMSRFASSTREPDWRPLDVVTAEIVYEDGKESYRNLKVDNKPVKHGMEELGGAWSTGEFGSMLRDLFSPLTAARFRFRRETAFAGRAAAVYDYDVDRENSHWQVRMASQRIEPAYRGAVWIDKATARVLRIEMEAVGLPEAFPLDKAESTADYGFVRLGTTSEYLLPVHAETLTCQRGTYRCNLNKIDFRNYQKYAGEATITFEEKPRQ